MSRAGLFSGRDPTDGRTSSGPGWPVEIVFKKEAEYVEIERVLVVLDKRPYCEVRGDAAETVLVRGAVPSGEHTVHIVVEALGLDGKRQRSGSAFKLRSFASFDVLADKAFWMEVVFFDAPNSHGVFGESGTVRLIQSIRHLRRAQPANDAAALPPSQDGGPD